MTKPVSVKTSVNGSNPSGAVYSKGRVLGVDGNIAQVQLPTSQIVTVRVDMLRGKSGAPKAGEVWILDQVYGQWLFAVPVGVLGVDLTTGGTGGGGSTPPPSGPTELSQLTDVAIANPIDTQVLTYDIASLKWKNKSLPPAPTPVNSVPYKPLLGIAERAMGFIEYQMRPYLSGAGHNASVALSRPYPLTYTGTVVGYFDPGDYSTTATVFGGSTPVYQAQLTLITTTGLTATAATTTIGSDGSFTFTSAAYNGVKSVRIIDTANSNAVVVDSIKGPGTVRSIEALFNGGATAGSPSSYTGQVDTGTYAYDQGMALLAALAMGRYSLARQLYAGIARMQVLTAGSAQMAIPVWTEQLTPGVNPGVYRLMDYGMVMHAAGVYAKSFPEEVFASGTPFMSGMLNVLSTSNTLFPPSNGLYVSGSGTYPSNAAGYLPYGDELATTTYSAEANMMAWFGLTSVREVIQAGPYEMMAALQSNIVSKLWNTQLNRFNRNTGNTTADTLRARILGYFFLHGIGRDDLAPLVISDSALTPFKHTSPVTGAKGYSAYFHSTDYTGSIYPIWVEGTCALALAFLISGDTTRWAQTLSDLFVLTPGTQTQDEDGSFPRALVGKYFPEFQRIQGNSGGVPYVVPDTTNDFIYPGFNKLYWSVSSAAMAILAICGGGIFGV